MLLILAVLSLLGACHATPLSSLTIGDPITIVDTKGDFPISNYTTAWAYEKTDLLTQFVSPTINCTNGTLWESGDIFDDDEADIGACAQMCYRYNMLSYAGKPCNYFNQIYNSSELPGYFTCSLYSCDPDDALVKNMTAIDSWFGWFDLEFTPLIKGQFQTDEESNMFEKFQVEPHHTCDPTDQNTLWNLTNSKPEECYLECIESDDCIAFEFDVQNLCTLFRVCTTIDATPSQFLYKRNFIDGQAHNMFLGSKCAASNASDAVLRTIEETTSVVACANFCRDFSECFAFQLDADSYCTLFSVCDELVEDATTVVFQVEVTMSPTPFPTYSTGDGPETPPPTMIGGDIIWENCNTGTDCSGLGTCVDGYCHCEYPFYGSTCHRTKSCSC